MLKGSISTLLQWDEGDKSPKKKIRVQVRLWKFSKADIGVTTKKHFFISFKNSFQMQ